MSDTLIKQVHEAIQKGEFTWGDIRGFLDVFWTKEWLEKSKHQSIVEEMSASAVESKGETAVEGLGKD